MLYLWPGFLPLEEVVEFSRLDSTSVDRIQSPESGGSGSADVWIELNQLRLKGLELHVLEEHRLAYREGLEVPLLGVASRRGRWRSLKDSKA